MTPLTTFDRMQVRAWIEESTNSSLSVDDPLPDSLIASAQAAGLTPPELRLWIFDQPKFPERGDWSGARLTAWVQKRNARGDEEESHG